VTIVPGTPRPLPGSTTCPTMRAVPGGSGAGSETGDPSWFPRAMLAVARSNAKVSGRERMGGASGVF
jgi:hypothetical protein